MRAAEGGHAVAQEELARLRAASQVQLGHIETRCCVTAKPFFGTANPLGQYPAGHASIWQPAAVRAPASRKPSFVADKPLARI